MLSRRHRFHGRTSLVRVYRRGSTVRAPHLALRYARNTGATDYRVAVIVSRKVHKSAVARNRLRRRIYEIIRTGPEITEPVDMVLTVFSDQVSGLGPAELRRSVHQLLARAGVYRKPKQPMSQAHAIVKPEKG
jgi:ribonuclease P protein component